ncbi:MAG: PorV/PorQ family protein [Bacteroidota bacterium]|nr:PorV/PorQ family protein [Bacteroidota bacterium]
MNIGVDASSMALSGAVTAQVQDVTAGYWNPAGLFRVNDSELALMHASYFANIAQYDYAGFSKKIDEKSAFGISAIRFGVDDIMNTTQLIDSEGNINYDRISLFSTADYGFLFSYARSTPVEGFTYGVNAKIIRRVIGDFASSWGFGFDFGVQYQKDTWNFGLMLRDITTTYNTWNINEKEFNKIRDAVQGQNQELPETTEITLPKMQLGVARSFVISNDYTIQPSLNLNMRFIRTNDIFNTNGFSIDPAVGVQADYNKMVFLRVGGGNFQEVVQIDNSQTIAFQPNVGLGFKYKGVQIDYALTDIADQSVAVYSHIFSLKVDLSMFKKSNTDE